MVNPAITVRMYNYMISCLARCYTKRSGTPPGAGPAGQEGGEASGESASPVVRPPDKQVDEEDALPGHDTCDTCLGDVGTTQGQAAGGNNARDYKKGLDRA